MDIIYIIGHRNPDTDSICSAIAYSYLKQQLGVNAVAARAGTINNETKYALNYFNMEIPELIGDFYPKAKDIMIRPPKSVKIEDSLFTVGKILSSADIKSVPVLDEQEKFLGIVSIGDLTKQFFSELRLDFDNTGTTYAAMLDVLGGKVLSGEKNLYQPISGRMKIAGSSIEVIKKGFAKGDIVIVGDRQDVHKVCLEIGVGGIILTGNKKEQMPVDSNFLKIANEKGIVVIDCPYNTYTCARLISQSIPVGLIMQSSVISFSPEDLLEDVKMEVLESNYRNYPVLEKGFLRGFINRNGLIVSKRQPVILVDHNEKSQAIEGIENTEILEIIDHHRLGGMHTNEPIYIYQKPVGCTSTIIAEMFNKHNIAIPKAIAGLLLSAILSDTLLFRSPTTTKIDKKMAEELSKIAKVDMHEYGMSLLRAGASFSKQKPSEIIKQDLKEFKIGKYFVSISQVYVFDSNELLIFKDQMEAELKNLKIQEGYDLTILMTTNILTESTELLVVGEPQKILELAFHQKTKEGIYYLPGVVSRKKQMVPPLAIAANEIR